MCDGAAKEQRRFRRSMTSQLTSTLLVSATLLTVAHSCYVFPSDVADPCKGVVCGPGEQCRPAADARSYTCECPTSCPSYGDHEGSRPLCGSDANDYPGYCQMRRAACQTNTNITIRYYGKCDPCAGVSCPDPEVCQLDENRVPSCRCAESCSLEFSPVCASDGKTYSNECQMNRESCRARKTLKIIFKGQCHTGVNPCAEVQCRHGAECAVERGAAVCACAAPCEPVLRPVCASDATTHDSKCELRRAACLLGRDIALAHQGPCGSATTCAGRVCPYGGECVSAGARGSCRCPRCSHEFAPVCGSDGISYGNRCKLQLEACHHRRAVSVLYDGPCNGCENKKCDFYAVCESDGVSEANCICPKHCEEGTETEEVCGSDNNTYTSICALRDTSCREQRHLHLKHMGSCESCKGSECEAGSWCASVEGQGPGQCSTSSGPLCATPRRTYPHACALHQAACEARRRRLPPPALLHYGPCKQLLTEANETMKIIELPNDINSGEEKAESGGEVVAAGEGGAACARVQCAFEGTCTLGTDGAPRCACLFDCAAAAAAAAAAPAPVCASDLQLYPTLCHMKLEACHRQEDLRLRPLALCRGLEFRPCGEDEQLTDDNGLPFDCGGGPHRQDCPAGSYCHHNNKMARCCRKVNPSERKSCQESWFGCCEDGVRAAAGPGGAGCSGPAPVAGAGAGSLPAPAAASCGCHRLGAVADVCEEGICRCRPGVGGDKCDRCEPGYWGLPRIGAAHKGCIPCGCSAFGSVREDCEQMTGRCVCKPSIQGQKCTVCSNHEHVLGPKGCYDPESTQLPATNCEHMTCYFGAHCTVRSGLATCECPPAECTKNHGPTVCGSDSRTYPSACHLRAHSCKTQSDVVVQAFGPCEENPIVQRENVTVHTEITLSTTDSTIENIQIPSSNNATTPFISNEVIPMELEEYSYSSYEDYLDEKERDNELYRVPLFDEQSSMTIRMRLPSKQFNILAEVSSYCGEGNLLTARGVKDYLWLGFMNSRTVLRWNAGSGPLELSVGQIKMGGRSKIAARRYKKDAILSLGSQVAAGTSPGRMTSLNLDSFIYLGQPPENFTRTPKLHGFVGCIHRLRVSGRDVIPPTKGQVVSARGLKPCTPLNVAAILCP